MRENASQITHGDRRKLYPPTEPFDQTLMETGDGHRLYVEQVGNPDGDPVVVLHGGPGGGVSPGMRRFFDPGHYRVILFDQRGCGRSTPHACVENNTTWHLVSDIEMIRKSLKIEQWKVFGGSWGAALALIYAEAHPDHVAHLFLRGVFLMTQGELDWFYAGGAGRFFPEEWRTFASAIPEEEQDDLIAAYHRRLFGDDPQAQMEFARIWTGWESALASLQNKGRGSPSGAYAKAFARLECHYFQNKGFLGQDGQILADIGRIQHIGGTIVQGRYDMICPPAMAERLHRSWQASELNITPTDGHALSEPGISAALVEALDRARTG